MASTTSTIRVCGLPEVGDASRDEYTALQCGEVGLSLASVVEVEVDHDVVGIVGGTQDPAATAPAK